MGRRRQTKREELDRYMDSIRAGVGVQILSDHIKDIKFRVGDKIRNEDVLQSYDAGGYQAGLYEFGDLEVTLKAYACLKAGEPK